MKNLLFLVSTIGIFLTGCDFSSKGPDVGHIDVDIDPQLFFIDLFEIDEDNMDDEVKALHEKYGSYLDAYSQQIIKIGSPKNPEYTNFIKSFLDRKSVV